MWGARAARREGKINHERARLFRDPVCGCPHHRPILARAARDGAEAHDSKPARETQRGGHPQFAQAAEAHTPAHHPAEPSQLHYASVLGLGRRQVDRGGELRARPPARRRHRGEDRRHRRRSRAGAIARRLSQLLVQRARAREALDEPARQPRALQRRAPARRRRRLLSRHRTTQVARHHGALCRSHRRNVWPRWSSFTG
jgi:hypothetical protein